MRNNFSQGLKEVMLSKHIRSERKQQKNEEVFSENTWEKGDGVYLLMDQAGDFAGLV
jgi:hypothetical protein